jgi:hypothetical protein
MVAIRPNKRVPSKGHCNDERSKLVVVRPGWGFEISCFRILVGAESSTEAFVHRLRDRILSAVKQCHPDISLTSWTSRPYHPPHFPLCPMPTTKLEEPTSKRNTPEGSSATNMPPNDNGDAIPANSDNLKEAWTVVHKEPPRAQGAQKFLNKIGGPIVVFPYPRHRQGCILRSMLTYIGQKMSKIL